MVFWKATGQLADWFGNGQEALFIATETPACVRLLRGWKTTGAGGQRNLGRDMALYLLQQNKPLHG